VHELRVIVPDALLLLPLPQKPDSSGSYAVFEDGKSVAIEPGEKV
jgi:hypothetical protein